MFSNCLHGNDKIRSEEAGAGLRCHTRHVYSSQMSRRVISFFNQCKLNVCDFGGQQIRSEDTEQIEPQSFKWRQTKATWMYSFHASCCCVFSCLWCLPHCALTNKLVYTYTHKEHVHKLKAVALSSIISNANHSSSQSWLSVNVLQPLWAVNTGHLHIVS